MATKRKAAGWAAIAVVCVGGFEGMRLTAYKDPIGINTVCAGETRGVKMGDRYTLAECNTMLEGRLVEFWIEAERCVPALSTMPAPRQAAVVSLAYNIGSGAFCKSSAARLLQAGYVQAGCDAFMKWTKAGGVTFKGLVRRREAERALCLRDA